MFNAGTKSYDFLQIWTSLPDCEVIYVVHSRITWLLNKVDIEITVHHKLMLLYMLCPLAMPWPLAKSN
jgi:hypothetical protein